MASSTIFTRGSIFDIQAEAYVNPVNTVGISGAGLAKEFARRFPTEQAVYESFCTSGSAKAGRPMLVRRARPNPRWIIYFPTKAHWKMPSRLEYIEEGLAQLIGQVSETQIRSLAIPKLGCGLGGLQWADVRKLVDKFAFYLTAKCTLYVCIY